MNGVVSGGWAFVWAAYTVSAIILGGFAGRAIVLYRSAVRRRR